MKRRHYQLIICFGLLMLICSLCQCSSRQKRKVIFRTNTKFFLRLNGKDPIFNWTNLFQHGWGFRVNWPMPDTVAKLHGIYRRDLSSHFHEVFQQPGAEHYLCIWNQFVNRLTNMKFGNGCGVLCEISNIIRSSSGDDVSFFKSLMRTVDSYNGICPTDEYELLPYTDL